MTCSYSPHSCSVAWIDSGKEFGTDKMQAAVQEFFDKHLKPKPNARAKNSPQGK